MKAGRLYAIDGGDSFIYYGQVAPNAQLGFFRFRSQVVSIAEALSARIMSRFAVLRASELRSELAEEPVLVQ
jgi:hypothetical protein